MLLYSTSAARLFSIPAKCWITWDPIAWLCCIIAEETAICASICALFVFSVSSVFLRTESFNVIIPSETPVFTTLMLTSFPSSPKLTPLLLTSSNTLSKSKPMDLLMASIARSSFPAILPVLISASAFRNALFAICTYRFSDKIFLFVLRFLTLSAAFWTLFFPAESVADTLGAYCLMTLVVLAPIPFIAFFNQDALTDFARTGSTRVPFAIRLTSYSKIKFLRYTLMLLFFGRLSPGFFTSVNLFTEII